MVGEIFGVGVFVIVGLINVLIFGFLGISGSKIIFDALMTPESVLLVNPIIIIFSPIFIFENPDFTSSDFSLSKEEVFVVFSTSILICLPFSVEIPREKLSSSIEDTVP